MKGIESNIINSFRLVKNDIMKLQEEVLEVSRIQKEILKKIEKLGIDELKLAQKVQEVRKKPKTVTKTRVITKTVTKRPKKRYLASKTGKNFHTPNCPFAKNIMPKSRLVFKTRETALNKGYKPCNCVK
ncbi:MAG: hypothetical protein KKF68_03965 [Nanoarchaeota archaeon]|nr:hypothetical protein [Nanoarchaeota archaeon]